MPNLPILPAAWQRLRDRISAPETSRRKRALSFLLWLVLTLIAGILVWVVPRFPCVYSQIKVPMPLPTQVLMAISGQMWSPLILLLPIPVAFTLGKWLDASLGEYAAPVIVLATGGVLLFLVVALFLPIMSTHQGVGD